MYKIIIVLILCTASAHAQLSRSVDAYDKVETEALIAAATNAPGSVTEEMLEASVTNSLGLADSALQDLVDDATPQLGADLDGQSYSITNVQRDIITIPDDTNYLVLTNQSGSVFNYDYAGHILVTLPTNCTPANIGLEYTFINQTTNLFKIDADCPIDDSTGTNLYEYYSGDNNTNAWAFTSATVLLVETNWWHITNARGTWTSID